MQKQNTKLITELAHINSLGYTKYIKNTFNNYKNLLQNSNSDILLNSDSNIIKNYLQRTLRNDSTIVAIGMFYSTNSDIIKFGDLKVCQAILKEIKSKDINNLGETFLSNKQFLVYNYKPAEDSTLIISLAVDLLLLHEKFIKENLYTSVYQTVFNSKGECLYHPEVEYIGSDHIIPESIFNNGQFQLHKLAKTEHAHSYYLDMLVYKHYNLIKIGNQDWLVVSISPGFEINDLIQSQETTMTLLYSLFSLTLLSVLGYGFYKWKKEFQKRNHVEQENLNLQLIQAQQKSETTTIKLELLKTGLNSHFLFNSLSTLKALLGDKDETIKKAFTKLSKLYRYQLRVDGEQLVSLKDELDFAKSYIDIINLRLNNAINLKTINIEKYLNYKVLPISIQTLIENCIKHNVASSTAPMTINIEIINNTLTVTNKIINKITLVESSGIGQQNLKSRYALLTEERCVFKESNGVYIAAIPLLKDNM